MSYKVTGWVWENATQTGSEKLTLLALADMCNHDGECYPGVERIAKMVGVTHRRMQQILRKLEEDKVISIAYEEGLKTKTGNTNRYTLLGYVLTEKEEGVKSTTPPGVKLSTSHGVKSTTPELSEEQPELTEKLFASPHGNAAESQEGCTTITCQNCGKQQVIPFFTSMERVRSLYGWTLEDRVLFCDVCSKAEEQFATPPPTTPQLPKAVEDKFMAVVAEVREERAKKERKPNPIFDAVAVGSFGLEDVNGDKVAGARIGKIAAWLKKQPGEITPEMIMSFYGWYDRENNHTARPRDVVKFAEHWLKWQATGQKTAPTIEVIEDDIDWVLPSTREVVQYADKPE